MARNVVKKANSEVSEADAMGGSPGIPAEPDPNSPALEYGGPKVAPAKQEPRTPREDAPPRAFRVVGGPGYPDASGGHRAMYDGALTTVRVGRIFNEHQSDLDSLRKQGFKFEEIVTAPPATE